MRLVATLVLCMCSLATATSQTVRYVDSANPCNGTGTQTDPYCLIGLAFAAANPGDTILVRPGTYLEQGPLDYGGRDFVVRSDADFQLGTEDLDPVNTVISGQLFSDSIVIFQSGESRAAVLDGFTLRDGSGNAFLSGPWGGGIFCKDSSPTVQNCIIEGCSAARGGGIAAIGTSMGLFRQLLIRNNHATLFGGGIHSAQSTDGLKDRSTFCNSIVAFNGCNNDGSALYSNQGEPTFRFLTVHGNTGRYVLSVDNQKGEVVVIDHCIFWGNSDPLFLFAGPVLSATYSDIENGTGQPWFGIGCIEEDPQFVNPQSGDFYLRVTSSCIDAGDPGWMFEPDCGEDFKETVRPVRIVDMGAHEFSAPDCAHGSGVSGLAARYRFDKGSGTAFCDSHGSNHGTMNNGTWWTSMAKRGPFAVELDGVWRNLPHLVVSDSPDLGEEMLNDGFAIAVYYRLNQLPPAGSTYFLYEKSLNYWAEVLDDGRIQAGVWNQSGGQCSIVSERATSAGPWYHVLFTFENSKDRARIWINDRLDAESLAFNDHLQTSSANLLLGESSAAGAQNVIDGALDEVSIGRFAPSVQIQGDFYSGGQVTVTYGVRPNDDWTFAIVNFLDPLAPCVDLETRPFDGTVCQGQFAPWIPLGLYGPVFGDQWSISAAIPPGLSGQTILFQALMVDLQATPADGAWTNCATMCIR